jgi:hypothetical protein
MKRLQTVKYYFIIAIFLLSCKKYGKGYISGTVLEDKYEVPVKDARVRFYHYNARSEFTVLFDSAVTDSQGKFRVNYTKERKKTYHLKVFEKNHGPITSITPNNNKRETDYTIHIAPFTHYKLRFVKLSYSNKYLLLDPDRDFPQNHQRIPYDTTQPRVYQIPANIDYGICWFIFDKNDNLSRDTICETINVGKDDTLIFKIHLD